MDIGQIKTKLQMTLFVNIKIFIVYCIIFINTTVITKPCSSLASLASLERVSFATLNGNHCKSFSGWALYVKRVDRSRLCC